MIISLIAAIAKNNVIGKQNSLPWHLPDDMNYFMQTTKGHCVLMGRKNYESIPKKFRPLPNRKNILITRNDDYHAPGCIIVNTIQKGIDIAKEESSGELFVIGGGEIYELTLPIANRLYITEINAAIEGDIFFPQRNTHEWKEISRIHHKSDSRHLYSFDFVIYQRA